jgi:sucrose-6-phosphate hydrolase SacC (GH32 family)
MERVHTLLRQLIVLLFLSIAMAASAQMPEFPCELVTFKAYAENPIFVAQGPGHWDVKIRERGWILKTGDRYQLWFTGYDGERAGQKMLGYATSTDGIHWERPTDKPIYADHWVEDMMVVHDGGTYYMFAEGKNDQAQLLTSPDGVQWKRIGTLDIRRTNGEPIAPGPFGTPTAWREKDRWYLLYERMDRGVWLAESGDLKTWTHVQDEPVLVPGPEEHESFMIAPNQVVLKDGKYYLYYHGRGKEPLWSPNIAVSTDRLHWTKYAGNPLLPFRENKSSPQLLFDGKQTRLYTMHDKVDLHLSDCPD